MPMMHSLTNNQPPAGRRKTEPHVHPFSLTKTDQGKIFPLRKPSGLDEGQIRSVIHAEDDKGLWCTDILRMEAERDLCIRLMLVTLVFQYAFMTRIRLGVPYE
ncbi:hypothetical protein FGIG_06047 [Fasciola gigantica]|uniref:Uncharacterized protein n=1 Tax=Fasciola gigantica TaxID=46835 RepID=A0A504YEE2_FASGI|nr:hypothetical protein FGIG_06047 [Fasciola gigantica]